MYKVRGLSQDSLQAINELSEKIIEFYKVFDSWHCGLNQLKTFKKLSYALSVAPQSQIKQILDPKTTPRGANLVSGRGAHTTRNSQNVTKSDMPVKRSSSGRYQEAATP